jgi:hypothetical protein
MPMSIGFYCVRVQRASAAMRGVEVSYRWASVLRCLDSAICVGDAGRLFLDAAVNIRVKLRGVRTCARPDGVGGEARELHVAARHSNRYIPWYCR